MSLDILFAVCFGVTGFGFIGCHLAAWGTYRSLVDYQYLVAREEWERDGKPEGGEITRKEIGFWNFSNVSASNAQLAQWVGAEGRAGSRPEWMIGDLRALTTYRRLRFWTFASRAFAIAMRASLVALAGAVGQW